MVKNFVIPCIINGAQSPFTLFIGDPAEEKHPLYFQNEYLRASKNGSVPQDVMEAVQKLKNLADKQNVAFEELCYYAINVANGTIENNHSTYSKLLTEL